MPRPDPFPAVVCAIMALGLALGPQVPGLLGHHEAIWGRGMSLLAASLPLVLLMLPRSSDPYRTSWPIALAGSIAGFALAAQWQTPTAPTPDEVAWAKAVYAGAYIALQALLTMAWLSLALDQQLRAGDGQVPYVPLLGAFLAAAGTGMGLSEQLVVPYLWPAEVPQPTGPWQIPMHPQQDMNIGDYGVAVLRVGMLVAALVPLAWLIAQRVRRGKGAVG
jgi:hypothetical protein